MQTSDQLRPGERSFALLLVLVAGFVFSEAYGISGFRGLTTGGVLPMLAAGVMLVSSLFILTGTLRKSRNKDGAKTLLSYLLPLRVVLFAGLVALYAALIPGLGFLAASGAFLFVAIWLLWRKGAFRAAALSALSILVIYLLFRVVFQVVLPLGSLWQRGTLWP